MPHTTSVSWMVQEPFCFEIAQDQYEKLPSNAKDRLLMHVTLDSRAYYLTILRIWGTHAWQFEGASKQRYFGDFVHEFLYQKVFRNAHA